MGGMLAFRDKGLFWKNFSDFNEDGSVKTDVGVLLKVKQISCYGNDSYGGMSGHDIMALATGLYEECNFEYQHERVEQVEYLAQGFYKAGVKLSFLLVVMLSISIWMNSLITREAMNLLLEKDSLWN